MNTRHTFQGGERRTGEKLVNSLCAGRLCGDRPRTSLPPCSFGSYFYPSQIMEVSKLQPIEFCFYYYYYYYYYLYCIKKPGEIFEQVSDIVNILLHIISSGSTVQDGKSKKVPAHPMHEAIQRGDGKAQIHNTSVEAPLVKMLELGNQIHIQRTLRKSNRKKYFLKLNKESFFYEQKTSITDQ